MSSCAAVLTLMVAVTIYQQPGTFWEYRIFDLLYTARTNIIGRLFYCYIWELPIFAAVAAVSGMAGALFVALNIRLRRLRRCYMPWDTPNQWWRSVEVLLIAAVTGTAWVGICWASPCSTAPPQRLVPVLRSQSIPNSMLQLAARVTDDYPQLWCPEGEYSVWGKVFWNPIQTLTRILIGLTEADSGAALPAGVAAESHLDNTALAMFMVLQYILVIWTYGSAIAFGAFTPSIAVGAAFGQLVGHLVQSIMAGVNPSVQVALPTYAVIGGASMLSGFVRYRVVAVVLIAELSGSITLVPVIAFACAIATFVGNLFGPGIYDMYNQDSKVPLLFDLATDADAAMVADRLQVQDVMATDLVSLPPVAQIEEIIACLQKSPHQSYLLAAAGAAKTPPGVVEMCGVISRKALLSVLKHRGAPTPSETDPEAGGGDAGPWHAHDVEWPAWSEDRQLDAMSAVQSSASSAYANEEAIFQAVPRDECQAEIDLRPFAHVAPAVLPRHASALQAHHIFRHQGSHEVFVTPNMHQICGVVSRKDLTLPNGQLVLRRKAQR